MSCQSSLMTIQRFCVQEFLLDWWKLREVLVDLQRWCLLVETFRIGGVVQRSVVVFQIVWWGVWCLVLILSQWKRFWVRVKRKRIVEKGFVWWRWLGVVCCVVLKWRWVVLTYAGVVIQDCLNEMSSRFFTNGSSEYRSLTNCQVLLCLGPGRSLLAGSCNDHWPRIVSKWRLEISGHWR